MCWMPSLYRPSHAARTRRGAARSATQGRQSAPATKSALQGSQSAAPATKSARRGSQRVAPATISATQGPQSAARATKCALQGSQSASPETKSVHKGLRLPRNLLGGALQRLQCKDLPVGFLGTTVKAAATNRKFTFMPARTVFEQACPP